ncbi:MAG: hypothetical protein EPN43_03825 [Jatrophihabitans sp.]|nr:MAG: hypothetical protein EPN43_03825 [Jatrophihabitans sp.]
MSKRMIAARRSRLLLLTGLLAAAAALAACSTGSSGKPHPTVTVTKDPGSSSHSASAPATPSGPPPTPVHITAFPGDGTTVGVGMPIIAHFNQKITDAAAFAKAVTVTVNGQPANGAWYFEYSDPAAGYPMEAHYREQAYWPAHARIHVDFATQGVSAGKGLAFDDSLTLDYSTGPANLLTADDSTHTLTVMSDGQLWGAFQISLGAPNTPTLRGVKVIMEKGADIPMRGPGYYDPHVKFTQRLTYGGEYLHSAPWNCAPSTGPGCAGPQNNIGRADTSNGCTNLRPADAQKLYDFLEVGDVVNYPNASGPKMQMGDGYGDWNVPWGEWQSGGAVATT